MEVDQFIKFTKNINHFESMIRANPNAFILLCQIAIRTKRTDNDDSFSKCEIGESLIGDYKTIRLSEKKYRLAKNFLEKHKIATFRGTNKGTIAKMLKFNILDPNINSRRAGGETEQGRTEGGQGATKKNYKKVKNDKNIIHIVEYLNKKNGTSYKPSSKSTVRHINARLSEGFTADDFETVIDSKINEWSGDTKMRKFLRPETLFGSKFESYLNVAKTKNKKPEKYYGLKLSSMR